MGFSRRENERERRARAKVAEEAAQKGETVNWLSLVANQKALRLVERELQEEAVATDANMAEIAERDAEIAEKYGGSENWQRIYSAPVDERQRLMETITINPELPAEQAQVAAMTAMGLEREAEEKRQAALDKQTNESLNLINKAMQKWRPPNPYHPLYKMVKEERRLERELNPKPREPAGQSWREKLTESPHWKNAVRRSKMTPAELAAEDAAISAAVNVEPDTVAKMLAAQAGWDAIDPETLAQMDFFGYVWPTDEK